MSKIICHTHKTRKYIYVSKKVYWYYAILSFNNQDR
jgi:hypothetical protein